MRAPLKTTLASWAPSINTGIIIIIIIIIIIRKKKNMQFDTNEAKLQQQKWDSRPNGTLQQLPHWSGPIYVSLEEVSPAHPGYPGQANFSFSFRLG